jgi:RND family efflux transporter MFP subunit
MTQSGQLEQGHSAHAAQAAATHGGGGGAHEGEVFDPAPHRPSSRSLLVTGTLIAGVAGALLVVGIVPRVLHRESMDRDEQHAASDTPHVRVVRAVKSSSHPAVTLPGSVQPLQETSIYARASGYVRKWYVDIGAEVKQGQLLVDLDLPDIEEELRQARATSKQSEAGIGQAKTQLDLARTTNTRYAALGATGIVSQQQIDEYSSAYGVQQSNLEAARAAKGSADANVRRLEDLRGFGAIVAPFDGVVTMRAAEVGQLVVSGTGNGQALFKVAEVDVVRVFVNVPQLYAGGVAVGMDAPTTIREAPGRVFPGKVAHIAKELDAATRSMLTEVDIPNPDRKLVSGMYAQVELHVDRQDQPILVPATAVLFDASGTRAAVVKDGAVHWRKVDIGADLGDRLAIANGLAEGEAVAVAPSERLLEGMRVQAEDVPAAGDAKGTVGAAAPPQGSSAGVADDHGASKAPHP